MEQIINEKDPKKTYGKALGKYIVLTIGVFASIIKKINFAKKHFTRQYCDVNILSMELIEKIKSQTFKNDGFSNCFISYRSFSFYRVV